MQPTDTLSIRINPHNPNHHLWRNNGTKFWIHYTVHLAGYRKCRIRKSLYTSSVEEARQKRDQLLELI